MPSSKHILVAKNLTHEFKAVDKTVTPFENFDFQVVDSSVTAVRGASGSGKTTLLLVCGGMRKPSRGSIEIDGTDLYRLPAASRIRFRSQKIGYLFQTLELIPYLDVMQNVTLAPDVKQDEARRWLDRLGMSERLLHKPDALSHGERQRVALARAISHQPSLVICDEPTGNLDSENSTLIFDALRQYADAGGSVLIASHDEKVNQIADEILSLDRQRSNQATTDSIGKTDQTPVQARSGSVSSLLLFAICSIFILSALAFAALNLRPDAARGAHRADVVRVYCAAGVAKPVEKIIERYNQVYDTQIEIVRTGGSGELAGQIATEFATDLNEAADLYISADDVLLENLNQKGIIAERIPIAVQNPVIAVRVDSNISVDSINALVANEKLKYGLASDRAAIGKLVRKIAAREGILKPLETNKTTDAENVMSLAQALATGSLDAAVIWDTTVNQINQSNEKAILKVAAAADADSSFKSNISVGVLASSKSPTAGLTFCRFLTGAEDAKGIFNRYGFEFLQGDVWEEVPEIHLYCGSMFTPVLESSIREFARREGVNLYPRWQGCGKLVASIEGTNDPDLFPDAFLACDVSFLEQVDQYFEPYQLVSSNDIVIAVRKELSARITKPGHLLADGIRFGICDPQQSALGSLSRDLLSSDPYAELYPKIYKNASVIVDVGPTLISQLMAGGLDAAIVYRSNVKADPKANSLLELVEIDSELARARQPWAIGKETRNALLMDRLFDWISREQIKRRFAKFGFREFTDQETLH